MKLKLTRTKNQRYVLQMLNDWRKQTERGSPLRSMLMIKIYNYIEFLKKLRPDL